MISGEAMFPEWKEMERVRDMSPEELDSLPFGVIQLDPAGTVLSYNIAESEISGRAPEQVIGKSFFEEVAPCTNVQEFAGRYRDGVASGELNQVFPYLFDFQMNPTKVWVRLHFSSATRTGWVFVTRDSEADAAVS